MVEDAREHWPHNERNRAPIQQVLERVLPDRGVLLEIGSGSGQHAAYFGSAFPGLTWQPSDRDDSMFASITAWARHEGAGNVAEPVILDVTRDEWAVSRADAVFNANTIHIAPWAVCQGLMRGVGRVLASGAPFVLYGPFRIGGAHTADSNARFDESLQSRDPSWGIRDLEAVEAEASAAGLRLLERVEMPANNQSLIFRKRH